MYSWRSPTSSFFMEKGILAKPCRKIVCSSVQYCELHFIAWKFRGFISFLGSFLTPAHVRSFRRGLPVIPGLVPWAQNVISIKKRPAQLTDLFYNNPVKITTEMEEEKKILGLSEAEISFHGWEKLGESRAVKFRTGYTTIHCCMGWYFIRQQIFSGFYLWRSGLILISGWTNEKYRVK